MFILVILVLCLSRTVKWNLSILIVSFIEFSGAESPLRKSELIIIPDPAYASESTLKESGWSLGFTTVLISKSYF